MSNPVFDAMGGNAGNNQANISQMFSNFANNFSKQFNGMSPEYIGQQLVQNGTIPMDKFQQFRQIANMVTGMNK